MNNWNFVGLILLGLYFDYGLRLARISHFIWTHQDTEKQALGKGKNLFFLVLCLCLMWPLIIPFSYLELLSKRKTLLLLKKYDMVMLEQPKS